MEIKRICTLRFSDNQYITCRKSFTDYWDSGHEFGDHVKISFRDLEGIWVFKEFTRDLISSTVHVYKQNLAHKLQYLLNLSSYKAVPWHKQWQHVELQISQNYGFLLNSTFFRNLFFTKMCIIRAVTRNIHTQQTIILVTFHVLTIIDLSRTSILINQNYS